MNSLKQRMNHWRGLGLWNYYFIVKFALLWYGYLNFHPFYNFLFLVFLLFPLPSLKLHRYRNYIAIPIGFVLFYHDTWLPGIQSILSQGENLLEFTPDYLLELLNRFINWYMIGAALLLLVAYLLISKWVKMTVFTVVILLGLMITSIINPSFLFTFMKKNQEVVVDNTTTTDSKSTPNSNAPPTDEELNKYLSQFYKEQKNLHTAFPNELSADAQPFDILILQICSLGWTDIEAVHLENDPLWSKFDILFKNFNSVATYSAPSAIRLLRSSCGQTPESALYTPVESQCYLSDNLAKLGFSPQVVLDNSGEFAHFLEDIQEYGGLKNAPLLSQAGISLQEKSFDNEPIYNDSQLLNRWFNNLVQSKVDRSFTFFNILALHDGARSLNDNKVIPYKVKVVELFTDVDDLFRRLEQSGRKVMVIMVSEHGNNLTGDKLQIPGLRDIPSPNVTHIPAGIKFIGMKAVHTDPILIEAPSSYLALSELISRVVDGGIFNQTTIDWQKLIQNLPQTPMVSDNGVVTVMKYRGHYYILLSKEANWIPYN
ncbi:cellulose biosynthesis protein BcsG [Legionella sp. PC997]|uniref:cellulose biosynthesis protein BcsG n=1 Tax=Legionella sp. PC997 TaxID=2755562 RepID=UPI0015F7881B|nr:cellulose biosynthesis protein BcsG [Legionella sp. PC997]QMT59658.1 cellulose biosynthesis protein BcsG [Legionella sp. PC997]